MAILPVDVNRDRQIILEKVEEQPFGTVTYLVVKSDGGSLSAPNSTGELSDLCTDIDPLLQVAK